GLLDHRLNLSFIADIAADSNRLMASSHQHAVRAIAGDCPKKSSTRAIFPHRSANSWIYSGLSKRIAESLQFCGFSYDPGSALARVLVLAFVFIKLNHPVYFRVVLYWLFGMKLHVARFADAYGNGGTLHYPKIALGHAWPLF